MKPSFLKCAWKFLLNMWKINICDCYFFFFIITYFDWFLFFGQNIVPWEK